MIRVKLYQNKNEKYETAYNKWYPRVIVEETIGLEELSAHMASHNTPFSKGAIKGTFYRKGRAMICSKDKSIVIRIKKEGRISKKGKGLDRSNK